MKKNDKEYLLDFNPSGDLRFDFVKIEYDDYNNHTDGKIFERRFI